MSGYRGNNTTAVSTIGLYRTNTPKIETFNRIKTNSTESALSRSWPTFHIIVCVYRWHPTFTYESERPVITDEVLIISTVVLFSKKLVKESAIMVVVPPIIARGNKSQRQEQTCRKQSFYSAQFCINDGPVTRRLQCSKQADKRFSHCLALFRVIVRL